MTDTSRRPRIVVFGSLNADLVQRVPRLPAVGETLTGESLQIFSGGKGANQACAAARLGGSVAIAGKVGNDALAPRILADLEDAGVETALLERSKQSTGTATILVLPNGANCIMLSPGANHDVTTEFASRVAGTLAEGDFLLCQLEIPIESVTVALESAAARGAITILDPAPVCPLTRSMLRHVQILTPNQVEAASILGLDKPLLTLDEAVNAAQDLQRQGPRTVIVKMGELGCAVATERETFAVEAFKVDAVDTTAAGDTFNGALAVALSEGHSTLQAVAFAQAAAALSVTKHGAITSIPSRRETDAFLTRLRKSPQSQP